MRTDPLGAVARWVFNGGARFGRRLGGIRPRRVMHSLARRGFRSASDASAWSWWQDRWGNEFFLHPFYLLDRNIIAFGDYERETHQLIHRLVLPGMVCLDVGANFGSMALHLARRVGPTGHVFAFEPVPDIAERLRLHARRNQLDDILSVEQMALSDATGLAGMCAPDAQRANQGIGLLTDERETENPRLTVKTVALDDFVRDRGLSRLDFIKLDVQGSEYRCFLGGRMTIERFRPIIATEATETGTADLLSGLTGIGYRVEPLGTGGEMVVCYPAQVA